MTFAWQARTVRSIILSENSDNKKIDIELFKKIVGGDTVNPMGKWATAESCVYPGKLTFFANDMPQFGTRDAFAVQRRMWVMPMRAQFLSEDDRYQKKELTREGRKNYIFTRDDDINIQVHYSSRKRCVIAHP